ncbi:MAG TPA: ATP synthase subunit I [Terriglobales bacterium]|nr:ATP synthase subunit I [Terriglobales bacterium]
MTAERRVMLATAVVAVAAVLAGFHWGVAAAAGAALGGGLALLNLSWLRAGAYAYVYALAARSDAARQDPALLDRLGPPPRWGRSRFALRYVVCGVAFCAIFMSHLVPMVAVLAGLLTAPAGLILGVTIEAAHGWRRGGLRP